MHQAFVMDTERRREHVLIFPFMAQGHIIPFLALALDIERKMHYQITFINTPLNINKLQSSLPPTSTIRLRSIPFDSTLHGLPPDTENTDGLPVHLMFPLMEASFALEPDLRSLLREIVKEDHEIGSSPPPLCIITDIFFAWVGRVAHEFHIFHAIFASNSGFGLACYYSLWSNVPHWKVEGATEFDMEDFLEGGKIHINQIPAVMAEADGSDKWSVFHRKMLPEWLNADGMLFSTVEELDQVGLGYFTMKIQRPVWAIGPVLNHNIRGDGKDGISREECRAWFDSKPPKSVLYVCFGSQSTLTSSHIEELAMALEASGRFFIWVVRLPWLPTGFEERVAERGLILREWSPQVEILAHGSTGGFISHCGWNSTLEASIHGVPIIAWPIGAEQFFNVKLLKEQLVICVALDSGVGGCEINRNDIMRKIEMVMGEEEDALEVRRRVCSVSKVIADAKRDEGGEERGSSVRAMDEFFRTAMAARHTN